MEVGIYFADKGLNDYQLSQDVMAIVTAESASVVEAKAMVDEGKDSSLEEVQSVTEEVLEGVIQLGYISGGDVSLYALSDLDNPIATGKTSTSQNINEAGSFKIKVVDIDIDAYYLVAVSGGSDIDANDDGIIDEIPTELKGTVHALVTGEELKSGIRVNVLTDMAYYKIEANLGAINSSIIYESLNTSAKEYLFDVDGNGMVDYKDILAFDPVYKRNYTRRRNRLYSTIVYR